MCVSVCAQMGVFQWSCYTSATGPEHLSPPNSVLINDSFSAAWPGGGRGGEDDKAASEIRNESTDSTTVCEQVHYSQGERPSSVTEGIGIHREIQLSAPINGSFCLYIMNTLLQNCIWNIYIVLFCRIIIIYYSGKETQNARRPVRCRL